MLQGNWKSPNIRAFAIGAAVGALVAIVMPDDWSNLAYTPWYIGWFVFPSFLVFASICVMTLTDFVSNDGANPYWLKALWVLSGALVMGVYGLGVSVLARLMKRFRSSGSRRESPRGVYVITKQSRLGPGRFQWNTGGWFGTQLGSTVWLLVTALSLLPKYFEAGVVTLSCFLITNIFGLILFLNRNRVAPYPAIQWLIGVIGLVSVIALIYLNRSGLVQEIDPRLGDGQWGFYLAPALFGGLMAIFHIMERNAVKKRQQNAESNVGPGTDA